MEPTPFPSLNRVGVQLLCVLLSLGLVLPVAAQEAEAESAAAAAQDAETRALDSTATQWSFQLAYQMMPDYYTDELADGSTRRKGLDNYVQFIGREGDRGTYRLITKCENFIEEINRGDYDFIFTSEYTQDSPDAPLRFPVREWVASDPNVTEVVAEPAITPQPAYVYRVDGPLDPANCR